MRRFRDIPIRQKLMAIVMGTTATALVLGGAGIVAFDTYLFRRGLERDLSALSHIIADNCTAALAFNDPHVASDTLNALRARTHMVTACVLNPDGTTFAMYTRSGNPSGTPCPPASPADSLQFAGNEIDVTHSVVLDGHRIGSLVMVYDLGEIAERTRIFGLTVLGVLLVSSLVAFLLSSQLRGVIANPISQLVRATTEVSQTSDYSVRVKKRSGDELGVLVDRFNEMLAGIESRDNVLRTALREREEALRDAEKARERFRFMAESMPQKIFTALPTGEVDYFNRQWMEFTGVSFEQLKGWNWTRFIHPDDVEENILAWRHSMNTGQPFHFQHRFRRADGAWRWHLSRAQAMRDFENNISMWIGSNTDIHEQKEKEEELQRANDDLQQFAYSASHDLQEPIRNVAVYSEIVSRRYHKLLDADGRQFLEFLTEGGRRLATLVDDLLAYTRAGVLEADTSRIDSAAVLRHSLSNLSEAIRESAAIVTFDPLPQVYIGEAHLQQLFQNLIGNALKYRGDEAPRIHISAARQGSGWRFSVRDNGIGIDAQYREKIFGVFKRLHHDRKYSGTGIGLAICQRVIDRYGGRIWVESTPGRGSTFCFTLGENAPGVESRALESSAG